MRLKMRIKKYAKLLEPKSEITAEKYPSRGQVLSNLLYELNVKKQYLSQSVENVIDRVIPFWVKARSPTLRKDKCKKKLIQLYQEYRNIQRIVNKKNASKYEAAFTNSLHHLFEIDSSDALACMSVEDRPYLLSEKEKARRENQNSQKKEKKVDKQVLQEELPGEGYADRRYLASNELEAARKQMKKKKRTLREERQKQKAEAYAKRLSEKIILSGSSSQDSKPSSQGSVFESKLQSPKRKRLQILDEELSSTLDRTRTSNRNATFLIAKTAKSMGVDVKTLTVSEASVRRRRAELRKNSAQRIQKNFNPDVPLTIHVDGKLLPPLMGGKKKVDRLPILVTGHNIDQLLSVPALPSGKGIFIAEAICQTVREWNIEEQVKSICFDTTSSNTGVKSGSCVCTERILGKRLLYCACRHHVSELLLDAAVTSRIGKRNQPENPIFTNFRDKWEDINPSTYTTALDDPDILENVQPIKTELLNFCFEQLSVSFH